MSSSANTTTEAPSLFQRSKQFGNILARVLGRALMIHLFSAGLVWLGRAIIPVFIRAAVMRAIPAVIVTAIIPVIALVIFTGLLSKLGSFLIYRRNKELEKEETEFNTLRSQPVVHDNGEQAAALRNAEQKVQDKKQSIAWLEENTQGFRSSADGYLGTFVGAVLLPIPVSVAASIGFEAGRSAKCLHKFNAWRTANREEVSASANDLVGSSVPHPAP